MIRVDVELRESVGRFFGTILTEGRASSDRRELFVLGSCTWPSDGISLLDTHNGRTLARVWPMRRNNGEIRISTQATAAIREAVESKPYMSVEFHCLRENRTQSNIREIERALVVAAALVKSPSYSQTSAEIRSLRRRRWI